MAEWHEVIILFLLVILGSIATSWLYRKLMMGVVTRKEERTVYRAGKYGGYAKARVEKKR